jgi:type I restriction enzyme, S subunit
MKKYDSYKNSGIEWIGEIPSHWKKYRLAFNGDFYKGRGISKADLSIDGLPVMLYGDIYTKYNLRTQKLVRHIPIEKAENSFPIKKGDILFAASGETPDEIGKCICYLGEDEAYASGDVIVFRQKQNDSVFLSYLFNSYKVNEQKDKLSKGEIVVHIYSGQLRDIRFPLPPKPEQTAIATYLDRKTSEIDELIADKKRLLELYEEEKTAVINELVTGKKVWNGYAWTEPAEVKDSGIEWLGEIPEHWEVKRLSWCFKIIGSGTTPKAGSDEYYLNGQFNWLLTGDLTDGEIWKTSKKITQIALENYTSLKEYTVNSIVMAMYGATIGKLGILKIPTAVNQACCVMSNPIHTDHLFGFYVLLAARQDIINMSYGGGQPNISQELIKSFRVPVPPFKEQQSIVHHIETECKRIDTQVARTQKLIELLKEYREALISEVVTGKVKVV